MPDLEIKHVSMLDDPRPTANSKYGVAIPVQKIAERFTANRLTERSFDDLYWFEFVGLEANGLLLGFRQYIYPPDNSCCLVTCLSDDPARPIETIGQIAGVEISAVDQYDSPM